PTVSSVTYALCDNPSLLLVPSQRLVPLKASNDRSAGMAGPRADVRCRPRLMCPRTVCVPAFCLGLSKWQLRLVMQVIKVPEGTVLRGCKKTRRKLREHLRLRAEIHSQLRFIALQPCSPPAWSQQRDQPVRGLMWCPVVAPRKPPQAPRSSQAATQPAASEPGPSTPPPAKRSKPAAEPTQPTKGKGKAAKAKPAPQPGRWLDRDCNAALNMQRIGESRWRPLELCYWPDQAALPAKGKEYPGLGYKRLRDKPPKAQQQQQQPAEAHAAAQAIRRGAMFEAQVAFYLRKYLGKYVHGLDADALKLSVWSGDVSLHGLQLRPEALEELDLPITVPWARLGRDPVVVEVDRLYILAGPRSSTDLPAGQRTLTLGVHPTPCCLPNCRCAKQSVEEYEAEADAAELALKRSRVAAAEAQWLQDLAVRQQPGSGGGGGVGGAAGPSAWTSLQAFIDPILANLQLRVTNVHVRFEDDQAWSGRSLSLGLLLQRLEARTVDDEGRPTFMQASVRQLLRKAMHLEHLALYFDVDAAPVCLPPGCPTWSQLSLQQWDDLFLPQHHTTPTPESAAAPPGPAPSPSSQRHMGSAALRRQVQEGAGGRSAGGAEAAGLSLKEASGQAPGQDWVLGLEQVVLCLSSGQYAGGQALAQSLDCLAQASPHRHLRPRCRPHAGDSGLAARLWWRYAYRALAKRLARQRGGMSWSRLQRTAGLRKLYVPAYLQALQQVEQAGQAGGAASGKVKAVGLVGLSEGEGGAQLQAMEAQLEEGSILLFRRMAHAKLQSLHTSTGPRSASSPAKPSPPGAAAAAAAAGGATTRTWAGWLGLGPRLPPAAAPASADSGRGSEGGVVQGPGPGVGVERESLTVEEWGRLHELLAAQDQAAQDEAGAADKDTPFTLRARVHISVNCLALALVQSPVATSSLSAAAVATARGSVDGGDRLRTQPPASYTATPGKKSVGSASTGPMLGLLQPALLVAHASSERLTVQLLSFPTTMAGSLQVGAAGITTQYGQLFSTGALAQELVNAEGPAAPASPPVTPFSDVPGVFGDSAASRMQLAQNAMALEVVRAPQDNSSDVTASLLIAPSFITYVPEAVAAVTRFFTLHRDLDLVALQAQATSRAEALRRAAAQQLSALSLLDSRPRLRLTLCAHAPKVALPAPSGQALLLLDLGRFSLHSN
ncbi:hypothetical protein QJQ45_026839, partial [Haematococcus lacustris]